MIIDGHAYCFPPMGDANGFPTANDHLRFLQRVMADHRQPAWRLSDRAPGDNATLADQKDRTLKGLRDVNFRSGGYGRFVWTTSGADYAKQYLPPYLTDLSHSPEMLIAQMDYVGIDRAVLHASPVVGILNDYLADCVRRYPGRLLALASVPEWEVEKDPEGMVAEVARAYSNGLHGFQFIMDSRNRYGVTESWDGPGCRPFWDRVVALGKPIFFTLHAWSKTVEDYLAHLTTWTAWLKRYPDVPVVLTHGFPWGLFRDGNRLRLPDALFEPFRISSAKLELLFPISLGHIWDYPYVEVHSAIVQLVETLGSTRLIWGTDMPNVERHCNYRQTLDAFRVHCKGVISDDDIANIIGGTCARLFNLGAELQ